MKNICFEQFNVQNLELNSNLQICWFYGTCQKLNLNFIQSNSKILSTLTLPKYKKLIIDVMVFYYVLKYYEHKLISSGHNTVFM